MISIGGLSILCLMETASFTSADTIYLKNGKQILCDSAWENGREIRYKINNGTVGIPKALVAKIVKGPGPPPQTSPALNSNPQTQSASNPKPTSSQRVENSPAETTSPAQYTALWGSTVSAQYTMAGMNLIEAKDLPGALEQFQKAYQAEKNRVTAINLALVYFGLQENWDAQLYFNEALKFNPGDTVALNYLGEISWRNEDLAAAADYWEKSLSIKKDPLITKKLERLNKERNASTGYENTNSMHFVIRYDGGTVDPGFVSDMNVVLEDDYRDLSSMFSFYPNASLVVVLYPEAQFHDITDTPTWSGGANDGKIKLPVKGLRNVSPDLRRVLIHELTHSFVDLKTSKNCPVWLQEGLAQYVEGKRVSQADRELLAKLTEAHQLPPLNIADRYFASADDQRADILYLESLAFTEYLITQYQFYQMNSMLERLGLGSTLNECFTTAYMVPLADIEAAWRRSLSQ
ncbi:MAG TPA: peptidase MA family metallohydrolase [Acidobacteriota bacterium]|nr:peptidase MA family metallohydrolase [Acidobacteriota bacterium]